MNAIEACKRLVLIGTVLAGAAVAFADTPTLLDQHLGVIECRNKTTAFSIDAISHETGIPITVDWNSLGGDDARQQTVNV
jgi:hypothetical protein